MIIADICLIPTRVRIRNMAFYIAHPRLSVLCMSHMNTFLRPYGPPRPFYASLTAPPLQHLGCALSHLCHMVLGKFSIQNIWEWTHVHHCRQHMSRCPPMRCVALQAGLPIVRGGLYAPWGRSHVLIRLAAAGPDPSHGPSPPDP